MTSPANPNELYKLELPWFGAITCSPRTYRVGEKKCSLNIFSDGNKIKGPLSKKLCSRLHLENVHVEPWVNSGGGLALYWKKGIDLKVLDSSPTYIDAVVNAGIDDAWQLTGFYGNLGNILGRY